MTLVSGLVCMEEGVLSDNLVPSCIAAYRLIAKSQPRPSNISAAKAAPLNNGVLCPQLDMQLDNLAIAFCASGSFWNRGEAMT